MTLHMQRSFICSLNIYWVATSVTEMVRYWDVKLNKTRSCPPVVHNVGTENTQKYPKLRVHRLWKKLSQIAMAILRKGIHLNLERIKEGLQVMVGPAFLVNLSLRVKQALKWGVEISKSIAWENPGTFKELWLEPKVTEELWQKRDRRVRHQRGQVTKVLVRCWSRDIPGSKYSRISRPEAYYLLLTGVKDHSEWTGIDEERLEEI